MEANFGTSEKQLKTIDFNRDEIFQKTTGSTLFDQKRK
jgi:hypothetical protein